MHLPEASFVPFLRWALGGSLRSWRKLGWWGQCTQGLFRPHPRSPQRRARLELVSSSSDHQHSTSAQEAGGSPDPPCSYGEQWAKGEITKRCFPEQRRIGAELGFLRRVSLSSRQLPEASFVPYLRWALGESLPSRRRVGCWGQCTQGLLRLHPSSSQTRARLELVSSSSDHQQSTSAQGAGGSQTLLVPMASTDLGEKPESDAFLSQHALGLSLVSRGELHFRECSSQKLVLCLF